MNPGRRRLQQHSDPGQRLYLSDSGRMVGPPQRTRSSFSQGVPLMLYGLAVVLIIAWVLGLGVFQVGGSLIHLLLVLAIISVLWNVVGKGRRTL